MGNRESTSPWVYVGIGCGVLFLIGVVIVAGMALFGYRWMQDMREGFVDPVERDRRVRAFLQATDLPDGYHPMAALKIPMLFDLAMLSDRAPDLEGDSEGFDRTGFILIKLKPFLQDDKELNDLLEGRTGSLSLVEAADFEWGGDRLAANGQFEWQSGRLRWASYAGEFRFDREPFDGMATMFGLTCPTDPDLRLGIWFERVDDINEAELAGTIADPDRLKQFLGYFQLCPGG